MIELYGKTEYPYVVDAGRYILFRGHEIFPTFEGPMIVSEAGDSTFIRARTLIKARVEDEIGPAHYDGHAVEGWISMPRTRIAAVCDTIAEVNALVATSRTAHAIFQNALDAIVNMENELVGQSIPDEEEVEEIRAFTLLNNSGDSTITWEKENDEVMRDLIEKKMKQGVAFFVIPPKVMGFIPRPKSRVTDVDEIMKRRSVSVKDEDFAGIIASGLAGITDRPEIDTERAVQCHDPAVIARSQSIGVMPMRGG
ncbi:hypothetical protein O9X98_15395 [Agrobacterium salinitolerans]|nr:hypothetical protein [Agrobacterium salinitolerans]